MLWTKECGTTPSAVIKGVWDYTQCCEQRSVGLHPVLWTKECGTTPSAVIKGVWDYTQCCEQRSVGLHPVLWTKECGTTPSAVIKGVWDYTQCCEQRSVGLHPVLWLKECGTTPSAVIKGVWGQRLSQVHVFSGIKQKPFQHIHNKHFPFVVTVQQPLKVPLHWALATKPHGVKVQNPHLFIVSCSQAVLLNATPPPVD